MTPPRSHLIACPGCGRHVRASEGTCPFCRGVLADSVRGAEPRRAPAERLSRAALYAFGVGTLTAATAAACGGEVAGQSSGGTIFYGSVSILDDGGDDAGESPTEAGTLEAPDAGGPIDATTLAPYGQVPFDAGEEIDATEDVFEPPPDVRIAPPYGTPPPPPTGP